VTSVPVTQSSAAAAAAEADGPFLRVEDLKVTFPTEDGPVTAVQGLSYSVEKGKTLGIVGESG
jgi:peptide/nickel transport system ATP-binding protein